MKKICGLLIACFMLAWAPNSYAEDDNSVEKYVPMAIKINEAIKAKDMKALAKLMQFPIEFQVRDQLVNFNSLEELESFYFSYDDVFSAETQSKLIEDINTKPCCSIWGYRGAYIANGIIFFTEDGIYQIARYANNIPLRVENFCEQQSYNVERWFFAYEGLSPLDANRDWDIFTNERGTILDVRYGSGDSITLEGKKLDLDRIKYTSSLYPEYKSGNKIITFVGEGDSDQDTGSSGIKHVNKIVVFVKSTDNNSCSRYVLYPKDFKKSCNY